MEYVAYARVCWGRWVADCPRPGCTNAEHFGKDRGGHVGGLTGTAFRCGTRARPDDRIHPGFDLSGCGLVCRVEWPPNIEAIEKLLALRPAEQTRNWSPGEDLTDLLMDNTAHGVTGLPSDQVEAGHPGGVVLAVAGDEITTDLLALDTYTARRALGRA